MRQDGIISNFAQRLWSMASLRARMTMLGIAKNSNYRKVILMASSDSMPGVDIAS